MANARVFLHRYTNSCQDEECYEDTLDCLKSTEWLATSLIDCYLYLLQENFPSIFCISTLFWTFLKEYTDDVQYPRDAPLNPEHPLIVKLLGLARDQRLNIVTNCPINLLSYSNIIIPIIHNQHWTMVRVLPKDGKMIYYDSLAGNDTLNYIKIRILAFFKLQFNINLSIENAICEVHQTDGHSCGVFICHYSHQIASGHMITTCATNDYREFISSSLRSRSLRVKNYSERGVADWIHKEREKERANQLKKSKTKIELAESSESSYDQTQDESCLQTYTNGQCEIKLKLETMKCLENDQPINVEIIDCYLFLLQANFESLFCVSTKFWNCLYEYEKKSKIFEFSTDKVLDKHDENLLARHVYYHIPINIINYEKIIVPIINENNLTLMAIFLSKKNYIYYDGLALNDPGDKICNTIVGYFRFRFNLELKKNKNAIEKAHHNDPNNSGVYLCHYANQIATGHYVTGCDPVHIRNNIKYSLTCNLYVNF